MFVGYIEVSPENAQYYTVPSNVRDAVRLLSGPHDFIVDNYRSKSVSPLYSMNLGAHAYILYAKDWRTLKNGLASNRGGTITVPEGNISLCHGRYFGDVGNLIGGMFKKAVSPLVVVKMNAQHIVNANKPSVTLSSGSHGPATKLLMSRGYFALVTTGSRINVNQVEDGVASTFMSRSNKTFGDLAAMLNHGVSFEYQATDKSGASKGFDWGWSSRRQQAKAKRDIEENPLNLLY